MTVATNAYEQSSGGRPPLADTLARGLGWFSLALGATEFLAPGALARALGMQGKEGLIRAFGAREMITGVGILTSADALPWMWGRVGGDALDLAALAHGLTRGNPRRADVGLAIAAVTGVTALDVICAQSLASERSLSGRLVRDYSDRNGLAASPEAIRGRARDADIPRDMRIPTQLRPWTSSDGSHSK
jgi:hypothetical protein